MSYIFKIQELRNIIFDDELKPSNATRESELFALYIIAERLDVIAEAMSKMAENGSLDESVKSAMLLRPEK